MADVITRFKLETTQYDSKLRDESNRLAEFTRKVSIAGKEFDRFAASQVDAVRELGKMGPAATDAKDKVKELVAAYNALANSYNVLTKEQQQGDYGKAMAESLKSLQQQITSAKNEMNSTGGVLDQLKQKVTLNVDAFKLFNVGLTAAKEALDVAKDAFFSSESNVDAWGQTVSATKSIYESFLQTLNTGDFSGFIRRINDVIAKAREAYNALDELNTRMTIINPERTRLQARATELKAIIRREGAGSAKGMAAQSELKALEGMLTQAFKTESELNMNAFKAEVDKKLQEAGIKLGKRDYEFLMRTFSSDASYMAMKRGAKGKKGTEYVGGGSYDEGEVYSYDTRNMNQRLLDLFTDSWRQQYAPLLNAAFGARGSAASTLLSDARYLRTGSTSGGTGRTGKSTEETLEQINATILEQWQAVVRGMDVDTSKLKAVEPTGPSDAWKAYTQSQEENTDGLKSLTDALKKLNEKEGITGDSSQPPATKSAKDMAKDLSQATQTLSSISNGINSIFSGLESLGVDIPEGLKGIMGGITGIMTILTGISSLVLTITAIQGAKAIPVVGTFLASGGIVHAAGGYVGGNSYSNDNIPAMLDAGEIVMNKAQQGNIASQLQDGNRQMQIVGEIDGEKIILVVNRTLMRSGRGELVTWKN